jgi:hypothetical protein
MTICNTNEFVQYQFLDGVLIVRYINKMGTNGGGGMVDGVPLQRLQAILVLGWNPNPDANLFSLIFVRIHTNEFIQLLYKSCSTNLYMVWFLYQFIHFLYELYSTNSYNEPRARAARAKPKHTSCPDQAAPGCPDVRVHPAAPTLGYTRLPRPLGYTRLPRR